MPANNPNSPDAQVVQGPGPTGNEGYPLATVPAPGAAPTDVNIIAGGGGAVTIADGADVCEGATTDAAVTGDNAGTVNAHLRGLTSVFVFETIADAIPPSHKAIVANVNLLLNNNGWDRARSIIDPGVSSNGGVGVQAVANVLQERTGTLVQMVGGDQDWADPGKLTAIVPFLYAGFDGGGTEHTPRARTPFVFKTVQAAAAGNTIVWTPGANRTFRLMRYCVEVTGNASFAVAAVLNVTLNDNGTAIGLGHDIYVPAVAAIIPGASYTSPWIDLGNGYLSAASGNVLNVNLSAALATGNVRIIACGTEE